MLLCFALEALTRDDPPGGTALDMATDHREPPRLQYMSGLEFWSVTRHEDAIAVLSGR